MTNKNHEIESLRAYAIAITVIAHMGTLIPKLSPYLTYFWLGGGVDLFFCVSGYVITSSLLREQGKYFPDEDIHSTRNAIHRFVPFWIRRVFRLWPAVFFWSIFVILCSYTFNNSGAFGSLKDNITLSVASWLQVANFSIISSAYFHFSDYAMSAMRVCWSLSLEEQFYIIFPVALFLLGKRKIVIISIILIISQFFLNRQWPSPLWFLRTDGIAFGVIIAIFQHKKIIDLSDFEFNTNKIIKYVLVSTLCLLLILVAKVDVVWFYHGLVAVVSAALVLIASFDRGFLIEDGKIRRFLSFVGSRSYSIYLTHFIAFYLTEEIFFRYFDGQRAPESITWQVILLVTSIAIMVTLSEFSYRIIETPLRLKGQRISTILQNGTFLNNQTNIPKIIHQLKANV